MIEEPSDEWRAELEATAGYDERQKLDQRALASEDPRDWDSFNHWMRTVTWPAELAVWKKANDWWAAQLDNMSPRRLASLPAIDIRCRTKGCLLGKVYKIEFNGGERYFFDGRTSRGNRKYGICNWPFADSFDGLQRWWQAGCRHGHIKLLSADLIETLIPAPPNFLDDLRISEELRLAWRSGVYLPPQDRWQRRSHS